MATPRRSYQSNQVFRSGATLAAVGEEKQMSLFQGGWRVLTGFVIAAGALGQSQAATIKFDEQPLGKIINTQYTASLGVTISADNFAPGHPDLATIFNTNAKGTPDSDLEYAWDGGNLKGLGNGVVRKILIIAENAIDSDKNGLIDAPDDEGSVRPAGTLNFKFKNLQSSFGLDLIDCDGASEFGADRGYMAFFLRGVEIGRVGWGAFTDPTSKYYDSTAHWGNNFANRLKPVSIAQLGIQAFDEVRVNLGYSTGIDNITFDNSDVSLIIPEPASIGLLGLPLVFAGRRRKVG